MSKYPSSYLEDSDSNLGQNSFGERWWLGGSGGGNSNSPAISALGLLAFLFFLSLIQNSLNTSRWLMLNSIQGTTIGSNFTEIVIPNTKTKRKPARTEELFGDFDEFERIERERQKRSSDWTNTPESIPAHPIRQVFVEQQDKSNRMILVEDAFEINKMTTTIMPVDYTFDLIRRSTNKTKT